MAPGAWSDVTAAAERAAPVLLDAGMRSLVILGLAGAMAAALRRASAAARHWVWVLGFAGLLLLPVASSLVPGWRVLPRLGAKEAAPEKPPLVMVEPAVMNLAGGEEWPRLDLSTITNAGEMTVPGASANDAPGIAIPTGERSPTAEPERVAAAEPKAAARSWQWPELSWSAWAALTWLGGTLAVMAYMALGYVSLWLLQRRCTRLSGGPWQEQLGKLRQAMDVRRPVELLSSPLRTMPMTWGVWRTRLLVPAQAAGWTAEQRRAVLLHELSHVRRWDCLTQLLAQCVCALYWCNPLAWMAWRRMQAERELACDDLVLQTGAKASAYARHLVQSAAAMPAWRFAGAAALAMARPSGLEKRVGAILDGRRNRRTMTRRALVATLGLLAAVLLPVAALRGRAASVAGPAVGGGADRAATPAVRVESAQYKEWVNNHPSEEPGVFLEIRAFEREGAGPQDMFIENVCRISEKGEASIFTLDAGGAKGGSGKFAPEVVKRLAEMLPRLPEDNGQLPPAGRRILVRTGGGGAGAVRVYDRANMPNPLLEILEAAGAHIAAWVPEFTPASVINARELRNGGFFALTPDQKRMLFTWMNDPMQVFDPQTQKSLGDVTLGRLPRDSIAFSPDGTQAALASLASGAGAVVDVKTWEAVHTFAGASGSGKQIDFTRPRYTLDGKYLLVHNSDGAVEAYDTRTWAAAKPAELPADVVDYVPGTRERSVMVPRKGGFQLWDPQKRVVVAELSKDRILSAAAFSPDGKLLAIVSKDNDPWKRPQLELWNAQTGAFVRLLRPFELAADQMGDVVWTPDGQYLLVATKPSPAYSTQGIEVMSVKTGRHRGEFTGCTTTITGMALLADGRTLVAGCADGKIRYWDFAVAMEKVAELEKSVMAPASMPMRADVPARGAEATCPLDVTIYEVRMPVEKIGQLDVEALSRAAGTAEGFDKALAAAGAVKPVCRANQAVQLAGDTITITSQTPYVTGMREPGGRQPALTLSYTEIGARFRIAGTTAGLPAGRIELDFSADVSTMLESGVVLSENTPATMLLVTTLNFKGPVEAERPFVVMSANGGTVDKNGMAIAYVARVNLGTPK